MKPQDQEPWLRDLLGTLDASADALDAATLSRLNRARQSALQRAGAASFWFRHRFSLAGAACALVIGIVVIPFYHPAGQLSSSQAVEAAAVEWGDTPAAQDDDSELDMQFYADVDNALGS